MKLISFILQSKDLKNRLVPFLDHLSETCCDVNNFEVCLAIDDNKNEEEELREIKNNYSFEIKYILTKDGYLGANKNYNRLLSEVSDKSTYFISYVSDRYRFSSKNWDEFLKNYIDVVPDGMFFLRMAKYSKNLKARNSLIEAFNANETWGFFTRKLIEAVEGLPEYLLAHDCAFEMLNYYIAKNKKDIWRRDVVLPNILSTDSTISSLAHGLKPFYERSFKSFEIYKKIFFKREAMEDLKRRAGIVYLKHIIYLDGIGKEIAVDKEIVECKKRKIICIKSSKKKREFCYKISFFCLLREALLSRSRTISFEFFFIAFKPILKTDIGFKIISKAIESKKLHYRIILRISRLILGCGKVKFPNELKNIKKMGFL